MSTTPDPGSVSSDRQCLRVPREEMRRLGHLVVDRIVDHLEGLPDKPVTRMLGRESLEALLRQPLPRHGEDFQAILTTLERDVFGNMMHLDSPRFFAYVPG